MTRLTRGQARYFAVQSLSPVAGTGIFAYRSPWPLYTSVPIFASRRDNRAITREEARILRRRTYRRPAGPQASDWDYNAL